MNTRRNKKRPRKHRRKTRSRRQKGGDNEEYYTEELVEAIELGDIDNVISTLEQGADVNTRTQDTPILLRSVLHGDVEIVKILLKQPDIDVNAQQGDNRGATALIKALRSLKKYSQRYEKTIEIIKLLLKDKRTDVSIDTVYSTAFNAAMHNKAPPEIIDLINERIERKKNIAMTRLVTGKAKLDTGKKDPEDERDLVPVAKRDVATSISKFFGGKRKTRKNHRNLGGKKSKRKTRKTRSKRQRGGVINNNIKLIRSSMYGNKKTVGELLEQDGIDVNAKNSDGYTALILASSNGRTEIVKMLLEKRADVNAKDKYNATALIKASSNGHTEIVAKLLDAGADVNAKNDYGYTALIQASRNKSRNKHTEIVAMLLDNGADVNATDDDGDTALMKVINCNEDVDYDRWNIVENDIIKIVERLLAAGADVNVVNDYGKTALDIAEETGCTKQIKKLIIKNKTALIIPKVLERQQDRKNLAMVMSEKDVGNRGDGKMPYELGHKIGEYLGGGKRKTRKSKPKKRNRRSRKRAGANGDDSYDEGETTRESISQDEPFHVEGIDAIPLANEVHQLEMENLDDSWASHSSIDPNESFINPYESDESLDLIPN